jgi:hypothetical protein
MKLGADTEFRYSFGRQDWAYQHVDFGADFRLPKVKWVSLGAYYRHVFEYKGEWITEHRPHIDLKFKHKYWNLFEISNRIRFESRFFKDSISWRARERVQAKVYLWKLASLYAANEFFFKVNGYSRNRLQAGAEFYYNQFSIGGYGMLQSSEINNGSDLNKIQQIPLIGLRLGSKF